MPPLPADSIHARACKLKCEKILTRPILVRKVYRPANGCKALDAGDHHIVVSAGAVDDEQIAALIPAAYDAHMGVLWVKYQIAGQRLVLILGSGRISFAKRQRDMVCRCLVE